MTLVIYDFQIDLHCDLDLNFWPRLEIVTWMFICTFDFHLDLEFWLTMTFICDLDLHFWCSPLPTDEDEDEDAASTDARAVRFAQDIHINIQLQDGSGDGLIYPPYMRISYGHAFLDDKDANKKVQVSCGIYHNQFHNWVEIARYEGRGK